MAKVRSLFDKIIYSDVYEVIDKNMSFSNVGGRKQRNIRDNLFVLNASINDVINASMPKETMLLCISTRCGLRRL